VKNADTVGCTADVTRCSPMTGPLADPVAHAVVDASQSPPHMKNRVTSSYIVPISIIYYTIVFFSIVVHVSCIG
jgi:hypothetical protein